MGVEEAACHAEKTGRAPEVEDAELVRGFEAEIDELMTASTRVDREDPTWQHLAERRAWMRHWPGLLTI